MKEGLAMSVALDHEHITEAAKTIAALVAIAAGLSAAWARWTRVRRLAHERREVEAKAVRYLVDAQHHVLRLLAIGVLPENEIQRQEILIRQIRSDLARVDGHEDLLAASDAQAELVEVLTRTQAIKARKARLADGSEASAPEDK